MSANNTPGGAGLHDGYRAPHVDRTVKIGHRVPDAEIGWYADQRGRLVFRTNWHNKYQVGQPDYNPNARPVVVTITKRQTG